MGYPDYYLMLGVAPHASAREIRAAYHQLALKYHPDRNPGNPQAEEKFKQINAAYQILSAPKKRAAYDQKTGISAAPHPKDDAESFKQRTDGFSDFFNTANQAASYWGRPGFRSRRATLQHSRKTRPGLKAYDFVVQELVSMHTQEAITLALCENYDLTWHEAMSLINDIQTRQAGVIRHRQAPWMLPAAFSMLVGGVGTTLFGAYVIVFFATIPVRTAGNVAWLFVPQISYLLLQAPALLGYAWLSVASGIGITFASARSMQDAWKALSEGGERTEHTNQT